MALSVLHAVGIVAQVSVIINRLKLPHAASIVQNYAVLSQIKPHVASIVQNHAVQKRNNENISIVTGIISDK